MLWSGLQGRRLQENVVRHELRGRCLRQNHRPRRPAGQGLEGEVRLPARVLLQRLPQPEEALRHDEGWGESRLEGVRGGDPHRLETEVSGGCREIDEKQIGST